MDHKALDIYNKVDKMTHSPRETEARVLTNAALKLRHCQKNWESGEREKLLSEALYYNQRIWTIFQSDLVSDRSPLPEGIRSNVLRLSLFVDKQIFKVMAEPSPEKLAPIININLGLAAGLRGVLPVRSKPTPKGNENNDLEKEK